MREIKFRAWDKKTKKMRTVESIGFGELCYYNEGYPVVNMIGRDCINDKDIIIHRDSYQHELMQYTGLKDKTGKELYEGDIIKTFCGELRIIKYLEEYGAFKAIHLKYKEGSIMNLKNLEFKIIGNIYKNPELVGD
ncbi:hypothetical protein FDE94_08980 [Clostridium botulinum]|nr:hypothetical protein [Clostridium botulinum]